MSGPEGLRAALDYGLFDALFTRRSRRFGLGMEIPDGPLRHASRFPSLALSELEEALLVWAGTGVTGLSLGDLPEAGLNWLFKWSGRSWPCSCNAHSTELFYTNDRGLHALPLFDAAAPAGAGSIFAGKSRDEQLDTLLALYRSRVISLQDNRAVLPRGEPGLFDFNAWNANQPGTTLFIPVTNTTIEYLILLFLYFGPKNRYTIVDEMNGGRTCGLDEWVRSGDLHADARMSLFDLELRVLTALNVEQAFICQNMNLALQAMGLGGWAFTGFLPHHVLGVDPSYPGLGFRFVQPEQSLREVVNPVPVGRDGVFEALCPPYAPSMDAAVDRFLALREALSMAPEGLPYSHPEHVLVDRKPPEPEVVAIVKSFCNYVLDHYGRFPAFIDPMFVRLVFQAHHLDLEFYDKHYGAAAYGEMHRQHFALWHADHENGAAPPGSR